MTLAFIARNPYTRQIGACIASGSDDCTGGSLFFKETIGVVSVQASGSPDVGAAALKMLEEGVEPAHILDRLRATDNKYELRQVLIVPFEGKIAVHTGRECISWAGHVVKEHCTAAGNMLTGGDCLEAMEKAYMADMQALMHRRFFSALQAGIAKGGDVRGHRSAGLIILGGRKTIDVRITGSSSDPLEALWQKTAQTAKL